MTRWMAVGAAVLWAAVSLADEIHDAAEKGDLPRVQALVSADQDVVALKDAGWGRTPLHWAARGVHLDVLKLLVSKGADVRAADRSGVTALHSVARRGSREAAELLIARGAELNVIDLFGHTPLSHAVTGGHQALADWLATKGATVPLRGEDGRRLLHSAASEGNHTLVDWMIARGADVSSRNNDGGTLLHTVAAGGLSELAVTLSRKGFDVNQQDRYGWTPLHHAALGGHRATAEALLRHGAAILAITPAGDRADHLARRFRRDDVAELLAARGADAAPPMLPLLAGTYLGQPPPGNTPEIFAPGIVSGPGWEHAAPEFSPDGREVFWVSIYDKMYILGSRLEDGHWRALELAPFTGFDDCYPRFSPDGKRLFFVSYRPLKQGAQNPGWGINLWVVERTDSGWSEPRPVGPPFATGNIFGFSLTREGTIYYTEGGGAGFDIYRSRPVEGGYGPPERLPAPINSDSNEDEPFIAPDESYLLFTSLRGGASADIYISLRKPDGSWGAGESLGEAINTPHAERFPLLTRDGKYFFFGSSRNGNRGDIYWLRTDAIAQLSRKPGVTAGPVGGSRLHDSPVEDDLHNLCFHGNRGWIVAHSSGAILRSTDSGESWQVSGRVEPGYLESITFTDEQHGWMCGEGGRLYRSEDGGETWEAQRMGEHLSLSSVGFFDRHEGVAVGMDLADRGPVVLRSTDGGKSWLRQETALPGPGLSDSLLILGSDLGRVGGMGLIARTGDRGRSWTVEHAGGGVMFRGLFFGAPQVGWAVGSGGAVFRTTDAGVSWQERPRFTVNLLRSIGFVADRLGYAAGDRGEGEVSLWRTSDGGESWQPDGSAPGDLHRLLLHAGRLWVVGDGGTIASFQADGGPSASQTP